MEDKPKRLKVFLSYSHQDCEWAERLMAHLITAESQGLVEYWSDQQLVVGSNWKDEIAKAIKEAKVFVVLISPDYVVSPFSTDIEFSLIKEAADEGALILPVLIRPIELSKITAFQNYQFISSEALESLPPRQQEKLIIEIAGKINSAIIEHKRQTESGQGQVLASVIGGTIIGTLILPGIAGVLLGGLLGGALGNANKESRDDD